MVRLFIENNFDSNQWFEVELNSETSLNFTFIRSDIDELQNRSSSFSQNIEILGTKNNRKVFQHIYNLDRITPNTDLIYINKLFNCEYVLDGISFRAQLELESISVLNETDEIVFNCSIRSNTILIKDKIGDKLLKKNLNPANDLDFSAYKHIFNVNNVKNSWDSSPGSGYYYPIINYNNYGNVNNIPLSTQRPAIYAKEVIDKIFQDAGLTYDSVFLNSSEFKKIIHPWVAKTQLDPDELKEREFRAGLTNTFFDTQKVGRAKGLSDKTIRQNFILPNDNDTSLLNFYDNSNSYSNVSGVYTVKNVGMYRVSFLGTVSPVLTYFSGSGGLLTALKGSYSDLIVEIRLIRGNRNMVIGSNKIKYDIGGKKIVSVISQSYSYNYIDDKITISAETDEIQLYENDKVYISLVFNNKIEFIDSAGRSGIYASLFYRFFRSYDSGQASTVFANKALQSSSLFLGQEVDPSDGIPENIKQYDYLKSIMNLFNLVIIEDPINFNNFRLEPRVDVIGKNKKLYWDHKIDNNSTIEIERIPTLIRKNLRLGYTADSDFYNDDYMKYFGENETYGSYIKRNPENTEEFYDINVLFSGTPHNYHSTSAVILPQMYSLDDNGVLSVGNPYNMRVLYRTDIDTNSVNFLNYTQYKPFDIFLTGDSDGPNTRSIRITNNPWYNIGSITLPFGRRTIPTANHFENPYDSYTNDLNYGFQKTYYVPTPSTYPTENNLYNRFWSDYIESIIDIDSKIIKVDVKLTVKDIYDLSFDDVVVYSGQKWLINRIDNWVMGELASVELIKIKE